MRLQDLAVDGTWDRRMRLIARATVAVFVALGVPVMFGLPVLIAVTLPIAVAVVALEVRKLSEVREERVMDEMRLAQKKRRLAVVLAVSAVVAVVGGAIDRSVDQKLHDSWWFLFLAPVMIGVIVGAVSLLLLGWASLPRREGHTS